MADWFIGNRIINSPYPATRPLLCMHRRVAERLRTAKRLRFERQTPTRAIFCRLGVLTPLGTGRRSQSW